MIKGGKKDFALTREKKLKKEEPQLRVCVSRLSTGRSGEAQTRGLRIPNAARYQLRYTPIVYLIVVV